MLYNAQVSVLSENVYFAMGPMDIVAYKACFFIQTQAIFSIFIAHFLEMGYMYDCICCPKWLKMHFLFDIYHYT